MSYILSISVYYNTAKIPTIFHTGRSFGFIVDICPLRSIIKVEVDNDYQLKKEDLLCLDMI